MNDQQTVRRSALFAVLSLRAGPKLIMLIVLAHPRTGSSLAMQTIAALGYPIVGKKERRNLSAEANPRGYMEEHPLLSKGLSPRYLERFIQMDPMPAFKLSLKEMVQNPRHEQWKAFEKFNASIIITFRNPLESAVSTHFLEEFDLDSREAFFQITSYFKSYVSDYKKLSDILYNQFPSIMKCCRLLPFQDAHTSAQAYVKQLSALLPKTFSPRNHNKAVANIDTKLYRFRHTDIEEKYRHWCTQLGAEDIYQCLCAASQPSEAFKMISQLTCSREQ